MNKKSAIFLAFLLILYTFIPAAIAEQQNWYIAYYDYIMSDVYLQSGQKFVRNGDNAYEMPCFCLFDMNRDGTPELLISNADLSHAGGKTYLFSFQNNRVEVPEGAMNVSLGMHDTQYYYPDRPDYPGIFSGDGGMGYYYDSYYSFDWNVLKEDAIAETIYVP